MKKVLFFMMAVAAAVAVTACDPEKLDADVNAREVRMTAGGAAVEGYIYLPAGVSKELTLIFPGTTSGILATSGDTKIVKAYADSELKKIYITGVADGVTTVGITVGPGTKSDTYGSAGTQVKVYVGTGGNSTQKKNQTLKFANSTEDAARGGAYALQAVTGAKTAVTWTSSDPAVAAIEGNVITLVASGTTTITATAEASDNFNQASASYTLHVQ